MTVETNFVIYYDCWIETGHYFVDDSLVVSIWNDSGCVAKITTCLDSLLVHENEAFLDTNNCPWATHFVQEYCLAEPTGITEKSGFCEYPLYRFNIDELKLYFKENE